MIKLINNDCLKVLPTIPDQSVDLILTDPPYGTTQCKWDNVISFELMWKQLNRIIKDNSAIVLFGSEPFSSALRMSNIKNYKYDWKWVKEQGTGQLNCKKRPLKKTEDIMVFNTKTYKPQGLKDCNINKKAYKINTVYNKQKDYIQKKTGYPTDILKFKRELKNRKHPTQKPLALMEYLIKTYTNELEVVLDFTMGSGSTGVACCNTNRHFIGIELDNQYFKTAKQRINNENT